MDSPINSDEQDIDEINRQLDASAPTDHKYKRKFGIALAGFIVCLIIIIVGATLLILNSTMKKKKTVAAATVVTQPLQYRQNLN